MTIINILTYNVCWECIAGESKKGSANKYGEKCSKTKKINGKNLCFRNISKISSFKKFDIIGLQEGNISLAKNIIKKIGKNYKMIYNKSCKEYSIIIYNTNLLKRKDKIISGFIEECGRPFLFQKFINLENNKEIIIGNFHGPHLEEDWVTKYIQKCEKLLNTNSQLIIMGDFNKKLKKKYILKKSKINLRPINLKIKTCIKDKNIKKIKENDYNESIDNILISKNIKILNGPETLSSQNNKILPLDFNFKLSNYTSDHRPIATTLLI